MSERYDSQKKPSGELGEEFKDKPIKLKRYEEKLRQAKFEYNRVEGYSLTQIYIQISM